MTEERRAPLILDLEETSLPDAPSPAKAPPPEEPAKGSEMPAVGRRSGWGLGQLLLWLAGTLLSLWLGIAAIDFVEAMFLRHPVLGWIGGVLLAGVAIGLIMLALREIAALARLRRVEGMRDLAARAERDGDAAAAGTALDRLDRLYRGRPDLDWARERLAGARGDSPDALSRLRLSEREYMTPLDRAATTVVARTSRQVATATALIPLSFVDVLATLVLNLRMIREIAEIYGGRAGWLGSWRLLRAVAAHLAATGAIAVTDDILGPMLGGGILAKLSRRFGEGVVNGALTARVGVAAIEVCRPLPFAELDPPGASGIVFDALSSWRKQDAKD